MSIPSIVLIVGAGQLGSRYLQGLAKCSYSLRIYVMDINADALLIAQQRWLEVSDSKHSEKSVSFHTRIEECSKSVDVAIVATTARKRVELVAYMRQYVNVRYWILEKVLVQSTDELVKLQLAFQSDARVWVNTPRRMLAWHKAIRDNLNHRTPLHLVVTGKVWGLACNAIHFLDMLAWLSGESLAHISTDGLAEKWFEAKRPGNWEVLGKLTAQFSGGSTAILIVEDGESFELCYQFEIEDNGLTWRIDEEKGIALRSDGLSIPGKMPFQSEVTPILVDQILSSGQCELPTLEISAGIHRVFLDAMLAHWQKTVDVAATTVPIT